MRIHRTRVPDMCRQNWIFWAFYDKRRDGKKVPERGNLELEVLDTVGTDGGTRTHTEIALQRILSPLRLPFRHTGAFTLQPVSLLCIITNPFILRHLAHPVNHRLGPPKSE